jgi:hypothetical protein
MLDVDINDPKEQRKFGLSGAAFLGVIGLLRYAYFGFEHVPWIIWSLAAVLGAFALSAPATLRPLLRGALPVAEGMNWVMTRVVLTIAWVALITPTALLYRWLAGDPLTCGWEPGRETYWEDPDPQPVTLDDFRRQF